MTDATLSNAGISASGANEPILAADGTPLAIADSREGAMANAIQNDLHMVPVH